MNKTLCIQLAIDYCCRPEDVSDRENHYTEHTFLEGRRQFKEESECYLKLAVVRGKVLFTGNKDIIRWCEETFGSDGGAWFLEMGNLRKIDDRLQQDGCKIDMIHPFFISETIQSVDTEGYEIQWYTQETIEQFRGDERYNEAYTFCEETPDVIGVAAIKDGEILGMAGASADSPFMWQIGINVNPQARGAGIGKMLVALLKNEILKQGKLPYYGTAISHLASQKVALGAGFTPAWVELVTSREEK